MKNLKGFLMVFSLAGTPAAAATLDFDWRRDHAGLIVQVMDARDLDALESSGMSFGEAIGGSQRLKSTQELYAKNPFFKQIATQISQPLTHDPKTDQLPSVIPPGMGDIPEMVRFIRNFDDKGSRGDKDTKGGFFIQSLSNNSQYPYRIENDGDEPRHFDARWLNSAHAQMKLIAVVNRMDRVDFDPATCGEVRFVYRLSYAAGNAGSSLPFFANVVMRYPKIESCRGFAQRWSVSPKAIANFRRAKGAKGAVMFADWLHENAFKGLVFKQVELNFQSLRFTSGYMHDFGGQAMYMQRIFRLQGGSLVPVKLENTPDVLKIEKSPELLKKFVTYLKQGQNLSLLDEGRLNIDFDPEFLTDFSVSWSTLGRVRSANKPYQRLFEGKKELLNGIDFAKLKHLKSADALIERLDNLTCMGCHQSGGTAGFHLLGQAHPDFSHGFNRQELGLSPHAFAEKFRREAYVEKIAAGQEPSRLRPHSSFSEADWSGATPAYAKLKRGSLCLLDTGAHFTGAPSCEDGSVCRATVTRTDGPPLFGECTLAVTNDARENLAGAVCWEGTIEERRAIPGDRGTPPSYNLFAFQDKWKMRGSVRGAKAVALKTHTCVLPQSGAPLGRQSRACTAAEENFTALSEVRRDTAPMEICANQGGNGFDICAATGDSGACLESRVVRAMLDTCYAGRFCREDYICQKFPDYHRIKAADYGKKKNGKPVNQSSPDKIAGGAIEHVRDQGIGFCVPTYFLFNMRVDGHPSPVTGKPPGEPVVDRKQPVRGYR
ncbi:MAG: hypothetical protein KF767_16635 [Bdellovibrionaceae bacterium]|nr:hypothetical protein [Pseudobdellovibrionaceae bacterium]